MPQIWKIIKAYQIRKSRIIYYKKTKKNAFLKDFLTISPVNDFRLTLISDGLGWPNGLAIDRPAGRLYWNDGQRKTIESSDLSGQDRRIVVTNVPHPYGLVIVGTHMYWTDWQTKALHRADKTNGSDNTIIRGKLEGLMDIRSVQVRIL